MLAEQADRLANQGAHKEHADNIDCTIPPTFQLPGVKLTTLTQCTAYTALREKRSVPYTRRTLSHLDLTRYAVRDLTGHFETDATLWRNIRHPDIRRPIRNFLYRAMTGSLRIGDFWSNIPDYEMRERCTLCPDLTESLQHILFECSSLESTTIWDLVRSLWPADNWTRNSLTIGHILGCENITPTADGGRETTPVQRGAARLKRIIISESAFLVWALRCHRVIGGTIYNQTAITTRWQNAICRRLDIGRRLARSSRKPHDAGKVRSTWTPILTDPGSLPRNWATNLEVLVGIKLSRTPAATGDTR